MTLDKIENFWFKDENRELNPTTTSEIEYCEKTIGQTLPASFKELYMRSNGGVSNYESVVVGGDDLPLHSFTEIKHLSDIEYLQSDEDIPDKCYIFAGESHSWYAFDYSISEQPKIVYYDEYADTIIRVADSFDDFLAMVE